MATPSGVTLRIAYAASSTLARQIDAGAPADLFISADQEWMQHVDAQGHLQRDSQVVLLGNTLVLIAPADSPIDLTLAPGMPLRAALGDGRLALADPSAVPAGRYARAALTTLGVWETVADRVAPADHVRAALALVSRGEAPLGIVYGSDAQADPKVRVVAAFPAGTHPPIRYPAALTRRAVPESAQVLALLQQDEATAIFVEHGFQVQGR